MTIMNAGALSFLTSLDTPSKLTLSAELPAQDGAGKDGFDLKKNTADDDKKEDSTSTGNLTPYDQRERESVKNFITGSIYKIIVGI